MRKKPTIGIVGLGPVGSVLAAHLAKSGEDVVVEDVVEKLLVKIRNEGLSVSGITQLTVKIDKTASSMSELSKFSPSIIFIATKACFLERVLSEIKQV